MKTQPVLDSVLMHLIARVDWVSVELFPEDYQHYRLNHPSGAVLISYQGSGYGDAQDVFWVNQPRAIKLALTCITRSQWGDQGALALLDAVREALVGFEALNCKKASVESEQFLNQIEGLWQYQIMVNLPTQNVQHDNAEKV